MQLIYIFTTIRLFCIDSSINPALICLFLLTPSLLELIFYHNDYKKNRWARGLSW